MFLNIHSLRNKVEELNAFVNNTIDDIKSCAALCSGEHWISPVEMQCLHLDGFETSPYYARPGEYGGSIILIRNGIKYIPLSQLSDREML
ncbi:hypothetical protein Zmor_024032 [Zophobas morio]|uniref:Uncharacterized protein n=1 Tax=Zophobas morio TaxID=2755281 RepID=A0AA38HZH4_9CUCU|nr:hypothetical protein Zmor_024032 [Zophobas morio]